MLVRAAWTGEHRIQNNCEDLGPVYWHKRTNRKPPPPPKAVNCWNRGFDGAPFSTSSWRGEATPRHGGQQSNLGLEATCDGPWLEVVPLVGSVKGMLTILLWG